MLLNTEKLKQLRSIYKKLELEINVLTRLVVISSGSLSYVLNKVDKHNSHIADQVVKFRSNFRMHSREERALEMKIIPIFSIRLCRLLPSVSINYKTLKSSFAYNFCIAFYLFSFSFVLFTYSTNSSQSS